jgi:hypothetical protein
MNKETEWASDEEDTEDKIEVEEMDDDGDLGFLLIFDLTFY